MATDYTNIKSVIENIFGLLKKTKIKTKRLPDLALVSSKNRSGISKERVVVKILSRLPDAEIPITLSDGTIAPIQDLVRIIVDEIFNELHENSRIDVVIPPNGVNVVGQSSPTGQVIATNTLPTINGTGIIV